MENDKAKAFFILNEDDVIDRKIADVIEKMFIGYSNETMRNQVRLGSALLGNMGVQGDLRGLILNVTNDAVRDGLRNNFKIDHYYEQWNRTAGYRIRYGDTIIQQEQIKIGF